MRPSAAKGGPCAAGRKHRRAAAPPQCRSVVARNGACVCTLPAPRPPEMDRWITVIAKRVWRSCALSQLPAAMSVPSAAPTCGAAPPTTAAARCSSYGPSARPALATQARRPATPPGSRHPAAGGVDGAVCHVRAQQSGSEQRSARARAKRTGCRRRQGQGPAASVRPPVECAGPEPPDQLPSPAPSPPPTHASGPEGRPPSWPRVNRPAGALNCTAPRSS